ncbi:phage tail tip lysozyme [Sphingomonas abietis]|uniref:Phage tail tip lysozyme n=1 Tax=Sphingomonas abietis TaxID=3012344 RepID=A0ABY7NK26_9SPHN|nr:phage tail tip lysozyme [Sphingomonas abietis]WBO20983.1 phage tail tip lysozyme [Sphingomonas abietis]
MAQPNATYGIAITASDKTAKGRKSAEKNLGLIPKRASAVNQRFADQADRSLVRSSRGILRTFGQVEQASARVFGGRSMTSGITSRLSAVREAASAAGTGMGEAAVAGGALEGAMVALGVAGAATVGVLAAAAYGAFKLADGWAKGAAQIGRTADIIGVATKQLQEFNAAAERQGVDKGTATSALAGLSGTLNDARYGRNNDAIALLSSLGLKMQLNSDGTVNTGAMLPGIADAMATKNSSGRRTIAKILGIPETAIPAFSQGAKALGADMSDADQTAYIASPGDIARAKRIGRKGAIVDQMKDRAIAVAGSAAADVAEPGYDAAISAGRGIIAGTASFGGIVRNAFAPAATKIEHAADTMLSAAQTWSKAKITQMASAAQGLLHEFEARGATRGDAAAIAASAMAESGGNHRRHQVGGPAYGLMQWEGPRRALFKQRYGKDMGHATRAEQEDFAMWEISPQGTEARAGMKLRDAGSAYDKGAAFTRYYERPKNTARDSANRAALADEIARQAGAPNAPMPVHVKVELVNAPKGTKATVTAGGSNKPAVSHSMAF